MEGSRSPLNRLRALNCKSGPYSYTKGPPRYSLLSLEGNRTDIYIYIYIYAYKVEERMRNEACLEEMLAQKCC